MPVKSCATTDVGLRRSHNEDSYFANDDLGLYVVADGMGGHAAGEVASQTAVLAIREFVSRAIADPEMTFPFGVDRSLSDMENILLSAVKVANQYICKMASDKPEISGMGTTVAGVKVQNGDAIVFHVGDSRVYSIRREEITQLTMDHSWVNEQLQRRMITEDEARRHRWRNVITRALGNKSAIEVDMKTFPMEDGDRLLLCTDGLSGLLSDEVILEVLTQQPENPEEACRELVAQANSAGGHDNITVILVKYDSDKPAPKNDHQTTTLPDE